MDISAIDQILVHGNQLNVINPIDVNPSVTAAYVDLTPTTQSTTTASIVQFSTLAQLLAATALFQAKQAGQSLSTIADFNQLATTTTQFVNAFNTFQSKITDTLASPFESTYDNALLLAMHTNSGQAGVNVTQSFIDSLSEVGITFQEASSTLNSNQFQINWTNLAAIYTADPAGTTDLLLNAFQALATIEQNLISPDTNVTTPQNTTVNTTNNTTPAENYSTTTTSPAATTSPATTTSPVATLAPASASASASASVAVAVPATVNTQQPNQTATIDPLIAVEIAAYRLNEAIGNALNDTHPNPALEVDKDISMVPDVEPITLITKDMGTASFTHDAN